VLHVIGAKYEGDTVSLKVRRDKEEVNYPNLVLAGATKSHAPPFLGIVPMRDDPEAGVVVRYVYPKSPADAAGLKPGDRITKIGAGPAPLQTLRDRDQLLSLLGSLAPGAEVKLEVVRKEGKKTETLTAKIDELPAAVPDALPQPATVKKALEPRKPVGKPLGKPPVKPGDKPAEKPEEKPAPKPDPKKVETGLVKRSNAAGDREYWIYVPEDYDPNVSHALVIWLHPTGKHKDQDVEEFRAAWAEHCKKHHLIMVGPKTDSETGWVASDTDLVREAAREVLNTYTIDRQRVVAHGMGLGGQLAFYLGFQARDLVRGVATTGAVLTGQPREKVGNQPLAFFLVAGDKDPLARAVAQTRDKLAEHKYAVIHREIKDMGHQYLDVKTLEELVRWIDALDRM
jgi:predicted esterase